MKYPKLMEFLPDNLKNSKVLAEIAINQDYILLNTYLKN